MWLAVDPDKNIYMGDNRLIKKNLLVSFRRIAVFLLCFGGMAYAAQTFVISDIRVEGLERISPGTVFNYLPMKVGDNFDDSRSTEAVKALFKTGFFDDVQLERDGSVLVFILKERPAIGSITVSGNKDIKTEDLLEGLSQSGFSEGEVFQRAMLEHVERELRKQYFSRGKYAARVETSTTPLENNRVAVDISISEGKAARIRQINIVGNTVWDEDELLDMFSSRVSGWLRHFTRGDQYSKQKLSADLETLRSHYLDHGYLGFNIDSTQISITPDKKNIYITINIVEGEQYTVTDVTLAGEYQLPEQDLRELITIEEGELFSRKKVADTAASLVDKLGDQGYAFANVNPIPDIDKENRQVAMTFFVDPGKRVYVRRINFFGNDTTRDEVLRREMRQQESAWASTSQVDRGRLRLQRTGYFGNVDVETKSVPGVDDQVDVNYTVTEQPSGSVNFGLGVSDEENLILRAGLAQRNFLGTGKYVSFNFNTSASRERYQIGYANPYYTVDGISRGFNAFLRQTEAVDSNLSDFESRELGGNVNYGFPVSETNTVYVSAEYANTQLDQSVNSSREVRQFIEKEGNEFDILNLGSSFRYDTRNRAILPDKGTLAHIQTELSVPFLGNSLQYFKLNLRTQWFRHLIRGFTLSLYGEFGYGTGYGGTSDLPFFKYFYAGGPSSVRGFRANTLGPKDSAGQAIGGEVKTVFRSSILIPLPFLKQFENSVRLTTFIDAGNVYNADNFDLGELRYSGGVGGVWVSPVGQVSVSIAEPFGAKEGDDTQAFQFNFGSSF